jgi:hypothetical protein
MAKSPNASNVETLGTLCANFRWLPASRGSLDWFQ